MGKMLKTVAMLGLLLITAACSAVYRNHGYTPSEAELATIIVGVDTRTAVETTLGAPTATGVSNTDGLYYVSSRWRHFGPTRPRAIEREVVAVTFDGNDVVQDISRYGLDDGRVVALNKRVTNPPTELSFIRQLLGNVGRVNTQDLLGSGN